MEWTPEKDKKLLELKERKLTYEDIAKEMETTLNSVAKRLQKLRQKPRAERVKGVEEYKYKESHEIMPDGSHKSDKLVWMDDKKKKDANFLLDAHGFDADAWDLTKAENNIWNGYSKQDGIMTLYSSRISAKPKVLKFDWTRLHNLIEQKPSIHVDRISYVGGDRYLVIPLFDLHFGINDCEHYKPTQAKVLNLLDKTYKETLIILGSDLFHHNDHRNRTASGREIEHADMTIAWEEAEKFYSPILHQSLKNSEKVSVMFVKGNHSESLEWAFTKMIKKAFPQLHVDDSFRERKAHLMGRIMIGSTHGDKANLNKIAELFTTEFPLLWAQAKTREVLCGDKHHEEVKDKGGIVVRQFSTRNKTDKYHDDYGYTAAHKRFQVLEYSEEELEHIYIV